MAIGTTRGKRRLGRYVRPIRLRSGRSPEEVAELAVCSRQTVQRLESGDALPGLARLVSILGVIGATDQERAHALQLWQVANAEAVTIQHGEALAPKYRRFRMDEAEAVKERTLDTVIIPGLLQTPEYASEISRARRRLERSTGWEKHAGDERKERQKLLLRDQNPLVLHALIHEAAIRTMVGGPELMVAQLDYLLAIVRQDNVTIQVVPFTCGAHGAMSGPLALLSFPEDGEPESGYIESLTGADVVEEKDDVLGLADIWQSIADTAPSPGTSLEIIKSVRNEMVKSR